MIKDFLDAVRAGNASEAKTWFETMFYKELCDKMQDKKQEVARDISRKISGDFPRKALFQDD